MTARLALLLSTLALCPAALAAGDDWPVLDPGKWRIQESRGDVHRITIECSDPIQKLRESVAGLDAEGCARKPVKRRGTTYRFSVSCQRHDDNGQATTMSGRFTLDISGRDAFRMETVSRNGKISQRVIAEGERLGRCDTDAPAPQSPQTAPGQSR